MKVRTDKNLDVPIHMMPGDVFQLVYHDRDKEEQVLLEERIGKEMIVNYLAALDLDEDELQQLGLTDALVGLFGNKVKQ